MTQPTIIYTITDEAPALATHSLLPIVKAYAAAAGVQMETRDISLASRILAQFPERLADNQQVEDALAELGDLAKTPAANIIKLPNISASIPQLKDAIEELQAHGYDIPEYPEEVSGDDDKALRLRFAKVLGSAVNPVLREGNSDRRVAGPVKDYARAHPHSMGDWSSDSNTSVAHMDDGDFYGSEQSHVMHDEGAVSIVHVATDGSESVFKPEVQVQAGEVIDAARMSVTALRAFFAKEITQAKGDGVLLSLHLKATMMKVSDPIMFGHAVSVFFADVFDQFADQFKRIGVEENNGLADVLDNLDELSDDERQAVETAIADRLTEGPELAMVDSDRGITNLHVPNDVIIDASMPAMIRSSGQMWGPDGTLKDTRAMIPDRSYAGIYQEIVGYCRENGAFNVTTMGNVSNVGLMAQKAQEYGSHDKTFEIPANGQVQVRDANGTVIFDHYVEAGDIWRMCQTRDEPIRDWVRLAVERARNTGNCSIFWLDDHRAHDRNLKIKVNAYLKEHDIEDLDIRILSPVDAMRVTCERVTEGKDTISVTGNVLRDYLTDLFPILELGTSAKMLSIVPLLAGGGLFETGAGGSAPKHVQQFVSEGHLRWDSLGEFLALAVSLEDIGNKTDNDQALVLADALNAATGKFLEKNRSPSRKVGELDNRGSHFYLALYWAEALAKQDNNAALRERFTPLAEELRRDGKTILAELITVQGSGVDLGGYYQPDMERASSAMRPSETFNQVIDGLGWVWSDAEIHQK